MIRVVIADDHPLMREGVKSLLARTSDTEIVGEATNSSEVLAAVRKLKIDVLILDLNMPGRNGIELISQINSEVPQLPILVWTGQAESQYALRVMRAGARGYVNKDQEPAQLLEAIRRVDAGHHWINPQVADLMAQAMQKPHSTMPHLQLSPREHDVFSLLILGYSVQEIARSLYVSSKTVSTHKVRMMEKMNMHSTVELVHYAVAQRLIEY